jgi:two-component system, cell cycle response regulator
MLPLPSVHHTKVTSIKEISKISAVPLNCHAALVVIHGTELGRKYDLLQDETVVGRSSHSDICLDEESVSRKHAALSVREEQISVRDFGSTNGTYVNDEPVQEESRLRNGDFVKIGRTIFKFIAGNNVEAAYHEEIYRLTTIDGWTQVYNRRHFEEALQRESSRAHRYRRVLSLVLLDIDGFKQVNDTYGHLAGDFILKELAVRIRTKIRREDLFARYGGEEFALLLPEVGTEGARTLGEKIRKLVQKARFDFGKHSLRVTLSMGIGTLSPERNDPVRLVATADAKLYEAKRTGRNRVCG